MDLLCRACMKSEADEKFYVFEDDEHDILKFVQITAIKIKKLKICKNCFQVLESAFKFRETCHESHRLLKLKYNIPEGIDESIKIRQFPCKFCKKIFTRNYNLSRHMKMHMNHIDDTFEFENIDKTEKQSVFILEPNLSELAFENDSNESDLNENDLNENALNEPLANLLPQIKVETIEENSFISIDYDQCKIEKEDVAKEFMVSSSESEENQLELNEIDVNDIENNENEIVDEFEVEKPNPRNKRLTLHECPVCLKKFDRKYGLKRHSNVHNPEKEYECHYEFCKIRFATLNSLNRHFHKHDLSLTDLPKSTGMPFYQCPKCPRKFEKMESLSAHQKIHKRTLDENEFECKKCETKFTSPQSLKRHQSTHDQNKKRYKCNTCSKEFVLKSRFLDHMSRHSGVKPFTCKICKKGFTQTCSLRDHMRIHQQEKPFLCNECGKSFNNGSNLRQHQHRHSGVKRFACAECPAKFNEKGSLKSHMITHTGEKKHICEICSSSFTKGHSLRKHMRIHTGEKPFSCLSCSMKFITSNHLKRHTRTHTGEKPYKCTFCERAFSQSNDLIKHLRSHVGDKVYQCKVCPESFRLHTELRTHLQEHFQKTKDEAVLAKLKSYGTIHTMNGHTFLKTAADIGKTETESLELGQLGNIEKAIISN